MEVISRIPPYQLGHGIADTLVQGRLEASVAVREVLQWCSLPKNRNWLLMFDNVDRDHQSKPPDAQSYATKRYFPANEQGSILITSRLTSLRRIWKGIEISKVSEGLAKSMLENYADKRLKGQRSRDRLCYTLGS